MNIRPKLMKMASSIVDEFVKLNPDLANDSDEVLTDLAIEKANENDLPEKNARHLAAEVNKAMVLKTGSQDFKQCDPDKVVGGLNKFKQPVLKKTASYDFNEYNSNIFSSSKIISSFKTKKASDNNAVIVTGALKEEIIEGLNKQKTASIINKNKAESKLNEMNSIVDKLKRYGYSFDDLISKEASLNQDCIKYSFEDNASPVLNLKKDLFEKDVLKQIDYLKKTASEFSEALQLHENANIELQKSNEMLQGINKEGEVFLNV